jgi:hypothetical protein
LKHSWLKSNNFIIQDAAKILRNVLADFFISILTSNRHLFKALISTAVLFILPKRRMHSLPITSVDNPTLLFCRNFVDLFIIALICNQDIGFFKTEKIWM